MPYRIELTRLGKIVYAAAIDGPLGLPAVALAYICPHSWLVKSFTQTFPKKDHP